MRRELLEGIVQEVFMHPEITQRALEDTLRKLMGPLRAEWAIGQMYGYTFRKREELYNARGGLK